MQPQEVIRTRKSILSSSVSTLVLLVIFVGAAYGLDTLAKPSFSPDGLMLVGIVMAVLPALVWLLFFYQQDQKEPEPKSMVARVFILGGLLAMAVGIPLVEDIFHVGTWLYGNFWVNLAGAILVIGLSQEFLKFAAVRFSVYSSAEFDERTDGIIYATAAGLGFATVLNIVFVVNSGGANLGVGALRTTLTALAQASFAGITGYFLSRQKFDHPPVWWMPAGVMIAALLNGIFFTVYGTLSKATISSSGAYMHPWVGLVLAVLLSVTVTGLLSWFIRRDQNRMSERRGNPMNTVSSTNLANSSLSTILVIGMVILGLSAGWILMNSVSNKTILVSQSGVTAQVPAGWNVNTGFQGEELLFWTSDQLDPDRRYIVSILPAVPGGSLTDVVATRNLNRSQSITGYVVTDQSQTRIQNEDGYQVGFAYTLPGAKGMVPKVIKGTDYFLPKGDKVLVITLEDNAETFDQSTGAFQRFLESVRFPVGG